MPHLKKGPKMTILCSGARRGRGFFPWGKELAIVTMFDFRNEICKNIWPKVTIMSDFLGSIHPTWMTIASSTMIVVKDFLNLLMSEASLSYGINPLMVWDVMKE